MVRRYRCDRSDAPEPGGRAILGVVIPLGVHHVALNVHDAAAAIAFYTEVLGGTERTDRPDFGIAGAWIELGSAQVHLIELPPPSNAGQHFAIQVVDLDGVVAELRARGLAVDDPVTVGTDRQTFIDDPSGNTVELHEVGTGSP